jgi:hypothetical protein
MAYESLELSVETLDGQRLPGAAYSWSGPVGVSLPLDASKPFLTQTNQVGKYKATVSFGEGDVCVLETNLSGKPCQVFTDGDCNNTPVGVNANAEPNANIPNLAVGDVFNAGDYEVTVTQLTSGSQTLGWTGEGMVDQNLIARIKIPMTVEFKKIKINSCYQYYNRGENGAVVHTKVDPSWGSVVDLGTLLDKVQYFVSTFKTYSDLGTSSVTEIKTFKNEMILLKSLVSKTEDYTEGVKAECIGLINEIEGHLNLLEKNPSDCGLGSSNARMSANTCQIPQILEKSNVLLSKLTSAPPVSCGPTKRFPYSFWINDGIDKDRAFGDFKDNIVEGNRAHLLIEGWYKTIYKANNTVELEYKIPNTPPLNNVGYADIVNFTTNEIFEIKSINGLNRGIFEIEQYIQRANLLCNKSLKSGTDFPDEAWPWPWDWQNRQIIIKNNGNGVITYDVVSLNIPKKLPQPTSVPVPVIVLENIKNTWKRVVKYPALELTPSLMQVLIKEELMRLPEFQRKEVAKYLLWGGSGLAIVSLATVVGTGGSSLSVQTTQLMFTGAILIVSYEILFENNVN